MILMNDFKADPPELKASMLAAVARVIDSGWYILGEEVKSFEKLWAAACGTGHGVGTGNGMDAIEIGLRAMGIGSGDEIITTPMTAFATVLAILRAGATPVLADINHETGLLDVESASRCISEKTKAIVLVHLYGQIDDMAPWLALCELHGIQLIEDCAQAHLAEWNGRTAGSIGTFGAYSFYPTKNLGALGDGGIIVTSDSDLADKCSRIRNYGQSIRYHHPDIGLNSRLDEVQAAILSERLPWLAQFTRRRQSIAHSYHQGINTPHVRPLPPATDPSAHVYHLFVVHCSRRDALQRHLSNYGVQSLIHYPIPIHQQPPCVDLQRDPLGLSSSEYHANNALSLPCHPYMSDTDVQTVIDVVNAFNGS